MPRGFAALALWVIGSLVGASTAGAQCAAPACSEPADCSVNDLSGVDGPGCCTTGCQTIQFAVDQVLAGAVIKVAAGTYAQNPGISLDINKTVTLCGAQAGVDARTRMGPESIITSSRHTLVNASNVIVDGFTFEGVTESVFPFGLDMVQGTAGTQVFNNIFQNNIAGIGLANAGPSQVLICQNLFQNNNNLGSATGSGIYTDEFVCGSASGVRPCTNFLIEQNLFTGNINAGVDLSNVMTAITNVDISNNTFDMNGRAVLLFNVDQSTIHNNTIMNSTLPGNGDIRIFGPVDGLMITNNDMKGGAGWAIRFANPEFGGPSSGIEIHFNNIANYAGSGGMFGGGLFVGEGAYPGVLDATCNWWDDPCGPFNVTNNPMGPGEEVEEFSPSNVDFTPWFVALGPAPGSGMDGLCTGIMCVPTTTTMTTTTMTIPTTTTSTTTTTAPTTTTSTTTTPTSSTTTTTRPREICGNCLDDDANGLTDAEDPACCTPEVLSITQTRYRRRKSSLRIGTTMPDGTFAGVDPRTQPVSIQIRNAAGELVCCTIPPERFQRLFRRTFGFFDQAHTLCPPLQCLCLNLRPSGPTGATITAGGVTPDSPLLSPVQITITIDGQCASGPLVQGSNESPFASKRGPGLAACAGVVGEVLR